MTHIYNHSHGARIVQHDRNVFRIGLGEVEVIRLYDTSLLGETAPKLAAEFRPPARGCP
ncbi:Zinc-dependent hydroxylase [Pseudomonas aeruginosa]|nr:Zinc-dependent hydroxylase [Pseudomonas aeruginosa]